MTLLEGETDGGTNLSCLNDASWLCSLDSGSRSVCVGWLAASSGNELVERGSAVSQKWKPLLL